MERSADAIVSAVDPTAEFAGLVARPEAEIDLVRGALLIAAHSRHHRDLDLAAEDGRIGALADGCDPDIDSVVQRLFGQAGLRGNLDDYDDPRNSYLPDVLDRRLGIPISLAVVTVEVARRCGVELFGVGMPGHFLVGTQDQRWLDPFDGGRMLDVEEAAALYRRVHGPLAPFHRSFLGPTGPRAILARMIKNLERSLGARDPSEAAWALRLHLQLPGLDPESRLRLGIALGEFGAFLDAACALEQVAAELPSDRADQALRTASELRARTN